jgi:hypothetical protein
MYLWLFQFLNLLLCAIPLLFFSAVFALRGRSSPRPHAAAILLGFVYCVAEMKLAYWPVRVLLFVACLGAAGWQIRKLRIYRDPRFVASFAAAIVFFAGFALSSGAIPSGSPFRIVVSKSKRTLELFKDGALVGAYPAIFGTSDQGQRRTWNDRRTPSGDFLVADKFPDQWNGALVINYPLSGQIARGFADNQLTIPQAAEMALEVLTRRLPNQFTRLGGWVAIHGGREGGGWTLGCVALDTNDMRQVYDRVPVGTRVHIE